MRNKLRLGTVFGTVLLCLATTAYPQTTITPINRKWSVDIATGWDNGISGNINSGAIGTLNDQAVAIVKNPYEDVYGTGLNMSFGVGYMRNDVTEYRAVFTIQSLDADLVRMGDIGVSQLYGQYDDYQSFGLDLGVRRYGYIKDRFRAYADGYLGFASIDEVDVELVAPQANFILDATDFYDQTAAFAFGGNAGVLWKVTDRVGAFAQLGLRHMSGMSEVDELVGTGLDSLNDNSSRWTIPFTFGVSTRF